MTRRCAGAACAWSWRCRRATVKGPSKGAGRAGCTCSGACCRMYAVLPSAASDSVPAWHGSGGLRSGWPSWRCAVFYVATLSAEWLSTINASGVSDDCSSKDGLSSEWCCGADRWLAQRRLALRIGSRAGGRCRKPSATLRYVRTSSSRNLRANSGHDALPRGE